VRPEAIWSYTKKASSQTSNDFAIPFFCLFWTTKPDILGVYKLPFEINPMNIKCTPKRARLISKIAELKAELKRTDALELKKQRTQEMRNKVQLGELVIEAGLDFRQSMPDNEGAIDIDAVFGALAHAKASIEKNGVSREKLHHFAKQHRSENVGNSISGRKNTEHEDTAHR
jgi:hypothetical protein